jgi:K+ transporter
VIKLLLAFHRGVRRLTDGRHTSPRVTAINRLLLVWAVLALGGAPIFAHAIRALPAGVWVVLGIALALRLILWLWRRRS